ncbi:DNA type IV secretion system protein ComB10 [Helicobacter baculiformis]|uniref:DNA type IV secretion system protein ComB10 n=1 Tax=Helicobacter baculiformis TaxID=427351 RepID=A0ABV7ZIX5_9HELI|nr:DNA type IV secretion system protein ComB10 [Helicobacter baculiformis]
MASTNSFLKRKLVWLFLILFVLFLLWLFHDDQTDEQIESIQTKFPISDYLFKNNHSQSLESPTKTDLQSRFKATQKALEDLTKRANKPIRTYDAHGNIVDQDGNIIATQTDLSRLPKLPSKKDTLVASQSSQQQSQPPQPPPKTVHTPAVFDYSKANPQEKIRLVILAQRLEKMGDGDSGLQARYQQETREEVDYGSSGFEGFKRKNVASNENRLLRTITADRLIPAILVTPISSEIGGSKIVAQIESDIYAAMGRAVLIPKGSRAIGYYNSNNKIGEYRLEVVWDRILTPQGINIILSDAKGADVKGYNGLVGTLHNKYWERYGLPLAMSTLSNGLLIGITSALADNMGRGKYTNTNPYFGDYMLMRLTQQTGQSINDVVGQILREQVRIKPIITIREGSRIFISPNTDIWFPIPKNGEVLAQFFKEKKSQKPQ